MLSALLAVTTGREFRAARRRLYLALIYVGAVAVLLPLSFLTVSVRTTLVVLGLTVLIYLIALPLALVLGTSGARILKRYEGTRPLDTPVGVFYLVAPTREWFARQNIELLRLDQFVAVLIAGDNLQMWGNGRQPRLLCEIKLREGMEASRGTFEGYPCLELQLDQHDPLLLLQWKGVLGVQQVWPESWVASLNRSISGGGGLAHK